MKKEILLSTEELANELKNITTISTFAGVTQFTTPKLTKKCRDTKEPFNSEVKKISKVSIQSGAEYSKRFQNKLDKEGNGEQYKAGKNTIPLNFEGRKTKLIGSTKDGREMLVYFPNVNGNVKPKVQYFVDGVETDKEVIPNVLPKSSPSKIPYRKVYLSNVKEININGKRYINSDLK